MDFVTGLPLSNGYHTISVIVHRLTKMSHCVPYQIKCTTQDFGKIFMSNVFRISGPPDKIISSRKSLFMSNAWKVVAMALGINQNLSKACHLQTDCQTERVNAILEKYLRVWNNYQQNNWADPQPSADFCFNNTQSSTTKFTLFLANYGYHLRWELNFEKTPSKKIDDATYTKQLGNLHDTLQQKIKFAQKTQAFYINQKPAPKPNPKPGEIVWLLACQIHTTPASRKQDFKRFGHFPVLRKIGLRSYKLDLPLFMEMYSFGEGPYVIKLYVWQTIPDFSLSALLLFHYCFMNVWYLLLVSCLRRRMYVSVLRETRLLFYCWWWVPAQSVWILCCVNRLTFYKQFLR